jgi:hypothetical protein
MREKILAAVIITATAVVIWVVTPSRADAVNYFPNAEQSLAGLLPEMDSDDCINTVMASLTPTLVASGSALHIRGSYDVSAADEECWCQLNSSDTVATGTGRHFPKGALVPLRFANQYLSCSCDGAAIMTVCPNN